MEEFAVKQFFNSQKLPFAVLLLSILGFALRMGLYAYGVDEKGLIVKNHPLELALTAVMVLTVVLTVTAVRKLKASEVYGDNFGASFPGALGHILAAAGIALTVLLNEAPMVGTIGKLWRLLGLVSAPLLVWAGLSRARGKKPFVLTHVVPCVFFAFHLVCHYQVWCSDPQLQNYGAAFLGTIALMLMSYHLAAFDAGRGHRRMLLALGLLAMHLCIVSMANTTYLYLYLGGAVWAGTALCRLEGVPCREKESE